MVQVTGDRWQVTGGRWQVVEEIVVQVACGRRSEGDTLWGTSSLHDRTLLGRHRPPASPRPPPPPLPPPRATSAYAPRAVPPHFEIQRSRLPSRGRRCVGGSPKFTAPRHPSRVAAPLFLHFLRAVSPLCGVTAKRKKCKKSKPLTGPGGALWAGVSRRHNGRAARPLEVTR